jgi:hypothetical protein
VGGHGAVARRAAEGVVELSQRAVGGEDEVGAVLAHAGDVGEEAVAEGLAGGGGHEGRVLGAGLIRGLALRIAGKS